MDDTQALEIRSEAAGQGWAWMVEGWQLFKRSPWTLIGLMLLWFLISVVGEMVPLIGSLALQLLSPAITAGALLGVRELQAGRAHRPTSLFSAMGTPRMPALLMLAGLQLVVIFAAVAAAMVLSWLLGHGSVLRSDVSDPSQWLVPALLFCLFMVPMLMAFWFSPALVMLAELAPLDAMKVSFRAGWVNVWPLTVLGLAGFGLLILAMIPFGLGLIVLVPVAFCSWCVSIGRVFPQLLVLPDSANGEAPFSPPTMPS